MMIIMTIFAVIGVIAVVATLLLVIGSATTKEPELPHDLFDDCRGDLRQLQDWYFSQRKYEQTERVCDILKAVDDLWAEYDMKQEDKGNDALSI